MKGYTIKFVNTPVQSSEPRAKGWSQVEHDTIQSSIDQLLLIGAIRKCVPCNGKFVSTIFLTSKKYGKYRMILNLKELNKFICPPHFKMENHKTVSKLISANDYLATLDLKDTYHLVPIAEPQRKLLRFRFNGDYYEYTCLPFGLNVGPFVFTKLLKPIAFFLRNQGFKSVVYLDDFLLIEGYFSDCAENINVTCSVLQELQSYKKK